MLFCGYLFNLQNSKTLYGVIRDEKVSQELEKSGVGYLWQLTGETGYTSFYQCVLSFQFPFAFFFLILVFKLPPKIQNER